MGREGEIEILEARVVFLQQPLAEGPGVERGLPVVAGRKAKSELVAFKRATFLELLPKRDGGRVRWLSGQFDSGNKILGIVPGRAKKGGSKAIFLVKVSAP